MAAVHAGAEERREFSEAGYCIFRGALPLRIVDALRELLEQHVEARVVELVEAGVAPQPHWAAPLEQRWGRVVRDSLRAAGAKLPEFLAHTHWGAPTGRGNARDTGGPYPLLARAIHELYTSDELVSIAASLLPSARALRAHGDYWFRPAIAAGAFPEAAGLAERTTAFPLHQDAYNYVRDPERLDSCGSALESAVGMPLNRTPASFRVALRAWARNLRCYRFGFRWPTATLTLAASSL